MIKSLTLSHFKKHKTATFAFTDGLTVLTGANGCGKTTLLRAVLYALFGASAAGKKDHLTSWDADQPMEVLLEVVLPTHGLVAITRSQRSALVTQELEHGTVTYLASGQDPVTHFVETALGMSSKTFRLLMLAKQGDTQALLKMGPAGLQQQLEVVAKLGTVDAVLKLLSTDLSVNKKLLEQTADLPDLAELAQSLTSLQSTFAVEEASHGRLQAVREQQKGRLKAIRYDLTDLTPQQEQAKRWRTQAELHQKALLEMGQKIADWQRTAPEVDAEAIKMALAEDTKTYNLCDEELKRLVPLHQRLDFAVRNHKLIAAKVTALKDIRPQWETWGMMRQAIALAYQDYTQLNQQYESAKSQPVPNTHCHACQRPFGDSPEEQAQLRQTVARLEAEVKEALVFKDAAQYALHEKTLLKDNFFRGNGLLEKDMERFELQWEARTNELSEAEDELEGVFDRVRSSFTQPMADPDDAVEFLVHRVVELQTEQETASLNIKASVALLSKWTNHAQALEFLETDRKDTASKLEAVQQLLNTVAADLDQRIADLQHEQAELQVRSDEAKEALNKSLYALDSLRRDLARLRQDEETAQAQHENYARLSANTDKMQRLQDFLRSNRNKFVGDTWEALTTYASHLLDITTEGLITNLTRSEAGEFLVDEAMPGVPVEELAGGYQSIVGLCLRIALGHLFYGDQGFLLLDEPTADCNEENSARVAGMLMTLKSQVILVTHRQGDAMNATNLITL
jgi:DNA repair protein SbcC/Rad50